MSRVVTTTLVALALTASLPGVIADGNGTEHPDTIALGARWAAMKADLASGNVTGARATWDASFAPAAADMKVILAAVEDAFGAVAAEPDAKTALYVSHAQIAEKGALAVAAAAVDAALANGNVDDARAWFSVLDTKFPGPDQLAASRATFTESAPDAALLRTIFAGEYSDIIQAKVMKEAAETPILLTVDPIAAAKEAGEALGYHLSIDADIRARLGTGTAQAMLSILSELLRGTLAGNEPSTVFAADAIREAIGGYAIARVDGARAAAASVVMSALDGDLDIDLAEAAYLAAFRADAEAVAPKDHARIMDAFAALRNGNDTSAGAATAPDRQIIKKGILAVAYHAALHHMDGGRADEALAHAAVLAAKFRWSAETPAYLGLGRQAAANAEDPPARALFVREAQAIFVAKVQEEVEEVFLHWDAPAKALEKAVEAEAYYQPLDSALRARIGPAEADRVVAELILLVAATREGDRARAESAQQGILRAMIHFDTGKAPEDDSAAIVHALVGKIRFVLEEYEGYHEALAQGDTDAADQEMAEAKAFLQSSRSQFTRDRNLFPHLTEEDVAKVEANFHSMAEILGELGDIAAMRAIVQDQVVLLRGTAPVKDTPKEPPADEAGKPSGNDGKTNATGTVILTIGNVGALGVDTFKVAVTATGLPRDGAAIQLALTYDPKVLEATNVAVEFGDVKASRIDDATGRVLFNGAATGNVAAIETLATVTFRVRDASIAPTTKLAIVVEELTDAASKPLGVNAITGGVVDFTLAPASTPGNPDVKGDPGTSDTPGPAVMLVLGIVGLAALVLRRRRN